MHGQVEKKKEEEQLEEQRKKEQEKKQPLRSHPHLSMSEGPMQLKDESQNTAQHEKERRISVGTAIGVQLINESKQIEDMGRTAYEKSVEVELAALRKKAPARGKKNEPAKKKPRYGWKMDDEPPPADDEEKPEKR